MSIVVGRLDWRGWLLVLVYFGALTAWIVSSYFNRHFFNKIDLLAFQTHN
jgi:hypothetical protein